MTKGTKIFRITISTLLALSIVFLVMLTTEYIDIYKKVSEDEGYKIFVAGVEVTNDNEDDVLGDGCVWYDSVNNILGFENAVIEYDYSVIYSQCDLMVNLVGENKFILEGGYIPAVYAANYYLPKDLVFMGDGSLTIEYKGECTDVMGIYARNLAIESDITVIMPESSTNISNGVCAEGSLTIRNGGSVTVDNGPAKYSTAVKTFGNLNLEMGASLNVTTRPGTTETCKGITVGGSLVMWDDTALSVAIDDESAAASECLHVLGLITVGKGATLNASAKKVCSIEGFGAMELNEGAIVTAETAVEGTDILCYGAIVDFGATVNGVVEALGGEFDKTKAE